jgi:hypothetical protein
MAAGTVGSAPPMIPSVQAIRARLVSAGNSRSHRCGAGGSDRAEQVSGAPIGGSRQTAWPVARCTHAEDRGVTMFRHHRQVPSPWSRSLGRGARGCPAPRITARTRFICDRRQRARPRRPGGRADTPGGGLRCSWAAPGRRWGVRRWGCDGGHVVEECVDDVGRDAGHGVRRLQPFGGSDPSRNAPSFDLRSTRDASSCGSVCASFDQTLKQLRKYAPCSCLHTGIAHLSDLADTGTGSAVRRPSTIHNTRPGASA